uniref:Co-chaperone protein p23 n=1 Tax=Ananas comosus var. bracteatus TaxID=296719 RepID=A0A6V7NFJ1_ANACO|nr:unnamed protein product [Ananas comosus var. bracteatus]
MSRHPTLKWAQRSDKLYLTIDLPDAKDVKLNLEPEGKFTFSATKDGAPYELDIELFDKVDTKDKWIDEDEEDEKAGVDFEDQDLSKKKRRKKKSKKKTNPLQQIFRKLKLDCIGVA